MSFYWVTAYWDTDYLFGLFGFFSLSGLFFVLNLEFFFCERSDTASPPFCLADDSASVAILRFLHILFSCFEFRIYSL